MAKEAKYLFAYFRSYELKFNAILVLFGYVLKPNCKR